MTIRLEQFIEQIDQLEEAKPSTLTEIKKSVKS